MANSRDSADRREHVTINTAPGADGYYTNPSLHIINVQSVRQENCTSLFEKQRLVLQHQEHLA